VILKILYFFGYAMILTIIMYDTNVGLVPTDRDGPNHHRAREEK
jgi:hypothetical protein